MGREIVDSFETHPDIEKLNRELEKTPSYETAHRYLLKLKIEYMKKKVSANAGVELLNQEPTTEKTEKAPQEVGNGEVANEIRTGTHGVSAIQKPRGTGGISKPAVMGMPHHAGTRGGQPRGAVAGDAMGGGEVEKVVTATEYSTPRAPQEIPYFDEMISEKAYNRVRESVRDADQKAMYFLAALIAMLAFLITRNAPASWFKGLWQWSFADFLGFVSMIGLAVASSMMLAVLYPSLRDSDRGLRFLDVMTKPDRPDTRVDRVASGPVDYGIRALQGDFYELTKMCVVKYRNLRYGFWVGVVAAFISLLFLILSKRPHSVVHYYGQ